MEQMNQTVKKRSLISDLSDARTCLMGFAIFIIVLYHTWAQMEISDHYLVQKISKYIWLGYSGCDIFLFLSGFGLAFSLAKNHSFSQFMGRRAAKLFPSYYPFILVFILAMVATRGMNFRQALGNLTFTGFWLCMDKQFNWYVQAVMGFYLLAPVIAWIFREMGKGWKTVLLLVSVCVVALILYWGENQMIAIARLPVFLMGYYLGVCDREKTVWTKGVVALAVVMFFAGFKIQEILKPNTTWGNGYFWYPFILTAPGFCLIVARLRPYWLKWKPLAFADKGLCLLGVCSFEIYLVHDLFIEWFPLGTQGNARWAALALASSAAGIGYHYLVENVVKMYKKRTAQIR